MGPGHERGVPGHRPRRAGSHARPRRLQRQQVRRLLHQLLSGKDTTALGFNVGDIRNY